MNERYKLRTSIIFLIVCLLYLIIIWNLYNIQINQHDFFIQLGKQQYAMTIIKNAERGLIYDRTGNHLLAGNKESFSAFIVPTHIKDPESLQNFLHQYFPAALERWHNNKQTSFMYVKRKLTPEQLAIIANCNVTDIQILKEPNRFYPVESLGHIVGITDIDNHGLFGIELLHNNYLAGSPTTFLLDRDARSENFYSTREIKSSGLQGKALQLTIDANMQFLAYEDLKETVHNFQAQEGAVLVMNPINGEILVMAQYPDFDPNTIESLNLELTKNRLVTESYELGSVMKPFVALACLEQAVVQPEEIIDCENKKIASINGFTISTWKEYGLLSFAEVIQHSNNIGIAKVAQRLGKQLYDHYKKIGFGTKTTLNWPGEQSGFITSPAQWSRQSLISLSFGYEITATLLQLGCAFCIIANNGIPIKPNLLLNPVNEHDNNQLPLYTQSSITTIRTILEKTVKEGTAKKAALNGYKVMAKTGTANMVINGKYNTEHNIYTVAGIIEKDSYKRVIVTFIKDSPQKKLFASAVAAPLFERIAENFIIHDKCI